MRYYTKKWAKNTLVADMCFQLHQNAKAATFSDDYFESLYNARLKDYIKFEKRKARYLRARFDTKAAEPGFAALFHENLSFIKDNLPESILSRVADVRVLALGDAEYDIMHEITRYCGQVDRDCKAVHDAYEEATEALAEKIGWYKINMLEMLLNSNATGYEQCENGSLILSLYNDVSNTNSRLTLQNAILTSGELDTTARVMYYEITDEGDGRLGFGILCENDKGALFDFSATMTDLELA